MSRPSDRMYAAATALALLAGCDPALLVYPAEPGAERVWSPSSATTFLSRTGGISSEVSVVGDLDGDGIDDVVVSDLALGPDYTSVAWLLYGVEGGWGQTVDLPSVAVALEVPNARLGRAMPLGDLDQDGYADFALWEEQFEVLPYGTTDTKPSWSGRNGAWVLRGGPTRPEPGQLSERAVLFAGVGEGTAAGIGAAAGDLDGSGRPDLVITEADWYDPTHPEPAMYVFFDPELPASGEVSLAEADVVLADPYAVRVAIADLDGDGRSELVHAGGRGGDSGLRVRAGTDPLGAPAWGVMEKPSTFWWQLAVGDVDLDGVSDLFVADPGRQGDGQGGLGLAYGFRGIDRSGPQTLGSADWTLTSRFRDDQFGYGLDIAPADSDAAGTVLLGASSAISGRGASYLVRPMAGAALDYRALMTGERHDGMFDRAGTSVALGDIDGDGLLDALVAAPTDTVGEQVQGRIRLYSAIGR